MSNFEFIDRFQDAHGVIIDELHWIAASPESSDLKSLIEEIDEDDLLKLFPRIASCSSYDDYSTTVDFLIEENYTGLVARVYVPEIRNIDYGKDGQPKAWGVFRGISRIAYAYGETLEELMQQVEARADEIFAEYIAEDKKKKGIHDAHPDIDKEVFHKI